MRTDTAGTNSKNHKRHTPRIAAPRPPRSSSYPHGFFFFAPMISAMDGAFILDATPAVVFVLRMYAAMSLLSLQRSSSLESWCRCLGIKTNPLPSDCSILDCRAPWPSDPWSLSGSQIGQHWNAKALIREALQRELQNEFFGLIERRFSSN